MSETSLFSARSERVEWLLAIVGDELRHATESHPPMHSPHEGHSVIREELEELWAHVKSDTGQSAEAGVEAFQVAAMALRYVHDLLVDQGPPYGD
jgi:hypothetical protein